MKSHAPLHRDAERRNLAVPHPHADVTRAGVRADAQLRQGPDERILDQLDEPADPDNAVPQLEYRIPDQLSRSVESDIPAPLNPVDSDPAPREFPVRDKQVVPVAVLAQCHHRRVLKQHQGIRNLIPGPQHVQLMLELKRPVVLYPARLYEEPRLSG